MTGKDRKKDRVILRLSDMYFESTKTKDKMEGIVELEVIMINVNFGHNKKLLNECRPLYEYSYFVDRIRFHADKMKKERGDYVLEEVIDRAIEDLPKDFKIFKFILANKTEVKDMCLFEYNQEKAMEAEREEGKEEGEAIGEARGRKEGEAIGEARGRKEGRKEGEAIGEARGRKEEKEKIILEMVRDGFLPIEEAAKRLGITVNKLNEKLKTLVDK